MRNVWNAFRKWMRGDALLDEVDAAIDRTRAAQKEHDALIAESFAKKGKGAQGVQRVMALRIAEAIRKQRFAE